MRQNSVDKKTSDEAIEWYSKLNSGRASSEDYRHFEAWRRQRPEHAQAYADIEQFWALLEEPAKRVFAQSQSRDNLPARSILCAGKKRRRIGALGGLTLAAALIMAFWLPGALRFWNADYFTRYGERREIVLEDGSRLTLNTHSAVSVDFSPERRMVSLVEGEVYFQVARAPQRPFIVDTQYGRVEVTGTAFNVYQQENRITVTVSDGRVLVQPTDKESDIVELTKGLQTVSDRNGIGPALVADARQASAWRQGLLTFKRQPLAVVVDELNRYFPGQITIVDPSLRKRIVSGTFDLNYPKNILTIIEKTLDLSAVHFSDAWILLY